MRSLTYLAAFETSADKSSYSVFFPDLPGCVSAGTSFEETRKHAAEALGLHIYGMEKDGDELPRPSDAKNIDPEDIEGCIVSPVTVYPDLFRHEMDSRAVRTNTTIPAWLKELAEANGINYSQVLTSALMEMLDVGSLSGKTLNG
ncbi:MAG: type II toxin-antitoxin system HicB family antitoxin [Oscillospiraceae bacterium]|nr:type II toxin-antitoxin system HicB family antitoxin [Oscillospiraceae bacterium]